MVFSRSGSSQITRKPAKASVTPNPLGVDVSPKEVDMSLTYDDLVTLVPGFGTPPPGIPTGVEIENAVGSDVSDTTPKLLWVAVDGAESYDVEVAPTGTLTGTPDDSVSAPTTEYTFGELTNGSEYDFAVRAVANGKESAWVTITVRIAVLPEVPANLAITGASGGTVADLTPTITFTAAPGATSHKLQWSTDSGFSTVTGETTITMPTAEYTHTVDLLNVTSYWWRVAAIGPGGQGPWSDSATVLVRVYLAGYEFTVDDAAPLAATTNPEVGTGTLTAVQNDGQMSISGGNLVFPAQSTPAFGDLGFYLASRSRVAGRCLIANINFSSVVNEGSWIGFARAGDAGISNTEWAFWFRGSNDLRMLRSGSGSWIVDTQTLSTGVNYAAAIVLESSGMLVFLYNGSAWELAWVGLSDNTGTLYPQVGHKSSAGAMGYVRLIDLPSPFDTLAGLTTLNQASPTETDYTGSADQIVELTLTAPGTITEEAGIIYRKADANNYWRAYFTTAGAFKLDSVSGGTPTTHVNVAGVIAAGQTKTIRVRCKGSLHYAFAGDTSAITYRGQANLSHQNTQTTIQPDIGAGYTVADLRSWPLTSAQYALLDQI